MAPLGLGAEAREYHIAFGGFVAFEHLLAIPAAVELHRAIGRDRIAARIRHDAQTDGQPRNRRR
jgi:hypothetical protein